MVSNIFDDDLNPNDADSSGSIGQAGQPGYIKQPGNLGAGPVINFSGFVGSDPNLAAGQLMTVPLGERTYNPGQQNNSSGQTSGQYLVLQTNYQTTGSSSSQAPYGDMSRAPTVTPLSEATTIPTETGPSILAKKLPRVRADRTILRLAPELAPVGNEPSFLVRMRRLNPNDFQNEIDNSNGVSTSGPGLPFLFARGTAMLPTTSTSYLPRLHGLTVRATSIASANTTLLPSPEWPR